MQAQKINMQQVTGFLNRARDRLFGAPSDTLPRVDTAAFRRYATFFASQVTAHANALARDGKRGLDTWLRAMKTEVERLHVTAYTIGRGGVDSLSREDMLVIDAIVRDQHGYLDKWVNEMRTASDLPTEAYIANRARLYLGTANETLQRATGLRVGLPELPFYPGDKTKCHRNCKCSWRWKKLGGDGNFDVQWALAPAEHCPTCLARAAVANPLQIRDYVIVDESRYKARELYYE